MTTLRYSPPEGCYELQMKFTNHRGERLVGTLVSTSTSRDVVLLCHGSQANQSMVRFPALAYELAAAGLGSFRFDHPCAWGSDSQRKGPFQIGNHADEVEDMKAAIKFLKIKGKKVVAMLGHSKGGMNVMMYAATVGDVPKVVNLSGLYHVKERMAREYDEKFREEMEELPDGVPQTEADGFEWFLTKEDFYNHADLPLPEFAATIKAQGKVQLLCLHGRQDTNVPWEDSRDCAEAAGAELAVVDGDHNFNKPEDAAGMIAKVVEFCMAPGPEPASSSYCVIS